MLIMMMILLALICVLGACGAVEVSAFACCAGSLVEKTIAKTL